jgi:UDP-N-acetylglucosamine 4,6-dehydratase/UDP-glucose 4-epimerase
LIQSFENIDIVFHAAALKHVPKIEYNPFEAIKTNIIGSQNVIDASIAQDVDKVVCIGTDKAVSPLNTYGATKLIMEKLFVSANNYLSEETHRTKFVAVRYGNVLGSNGSVVPKFIELLKSHEKISITDNEMTRFTISMNDALDFILNSTEIAKGSEIFIPKMVAYDMNILTSTLYELIEKTEEDVVGIRPGEKLHEILINSDELQNTYEINDIYVILSPLIHPSVNSSPNMRNYNEKELNERYPGIRKITDMETYSSNNAQKISKSELKEKILDLDLI